VTTDENPYAPTNGPAITDLMTMFSFPDHEQYGHRSDHGKQEN
jgi:hypothetical protein